MQKHRGLGDTVHAVTSSLGIKAIVDAGSKALKKPCGCSQRRKTLNELFPYGKEK